MIMFYSSFWCSSLLSEYPKQKRKIRTDQMKGSQTLATVFQKHLLLGAATLEAGNCLKLRNANCFTSEQLILDNCLQTLEAHWEKQPIILCI